MLKNQSFEGLNMKKVFALLAICGSFFALTIFIYNFLPVNAPNPETIPVYGSDWQWAYLPALNNFFHGASIYGGNFFNPPWVLFPLIPLAFLSPALGSAVMYSLNIFAFVIVFVRLRISVWFIIPLILFSGILLNSQHGNIEGLIALGFLLPPPIGLFFVLAKPQVGIGVAVYWLFESMRNGGVKQVTRSFIPVAIAYLISFAFYGAWLSTNSGMVRIWWNESFFPYSVPAGLVFLALASWKRQIGWAIAAGPLFSPYVNLHTWTFLWIGLAIVISPKLRFLVSYQKLVVSQFRES
jgi:hypothetical protein